MLNQVFKDGKQQQKTLAHYQYMASMYSQIENSIALLSDMKANKSYIYSGNVAKKLDFFELHNSEEINSI